MAFRPNEFSSSLGKSGSLARQSHFDVVVNLPPGVRDNVDALLEFQEIGVFSGVGGDLTFKVDSTEFPGRSITNTPYRDYGLVRNMAFDSNVIPITMSVMCSPDFRERVFFEIWQDIIVGNYRKKSLGEHNIASKMFNIGYFKDYVTTITINQYDEEQNKSYECQLIDAYPQLVAPLSASWASDDHHRMNITWSYRHYTDRSIPHPQHGRVHPSAQMTGNWLNTTGLGAGLATGAGVLAHKFSPKVQKLAAGGIALAPQIFGIFR